MNIQEFVESLKTIEDDFRWELLEGREISNASVIRGWLKNKTCGGCCDHCFCPITAVARHKLNKSYGSDFMGVHWASEILGLSKQDADKIIQASDDNPEGDETLRHWIMGALDLT